MLETIQNIALATALALLGVGVGVMSMTPPDYNIARSATIGFGVAITLACLLWLPTSPQPLIGKGLIAALAAALVFAGCPIVFGWINTKEKRAPSFVGVLAAKTLVQRGTPAPDAQIEVGNSGVVFNEKWGLQDMLNIWGKDQLNIIVENDQLKVSTTIRDVSDHIIAELQNNEWKVSAPAAWDRNYTSDALEVKDAKGRIVLQVQIFKDIVKLQGVWWTTLHNQRIQMVLRETPENELPPAKIEDGNIRIMMATHDSEYKGQLIFCRPGGRWPNISPMFQYPSESHLGELAR